MTGAKTDHRRTRKRRWWYIRLVFWALFILWFARYAYVRWTTPPAAYAERTTPSPLDDTVAQEFMAAVQALPPIPSPTSRPAFGWGPWGAGGVVVDGIHGPWSPDSRPDLCQALKYVRQSQVNEALDRIVAATEGARQAGAETVLAAGFRAPSGWLQANECVAPMIALAFRARYRHTEQANLAGALADLRAALFVSQRDYVVLSLAGGWWGDQWVSFIPQFELACLVQERDIPPLLAREMVEFLKTKLSLSVGQTVAFHSGLHQDIQQLLDRYYTDDGEGNGWLVLSAAHDVQFMFGMGPSAPRSEFWNLFSPLFNDRRTMAAKFVRQVEALERLDSVDYRGGRAIVTGQRQPGRAVSLLDGPLMKVTSGIDPEFYQVGFAQVMRRRAIVVMLALSAYKHEHGEYPATLEALVPSYLDEVPLDAFTHEPFRYTRDSPSSYDLGPARPLDDELYQTWPLRDFDFPADSYLPQRGEIRVPDQTEGE
ncbi:MAG TPA: hypothetical protein VM487_04010 [Phycisphaerae bacterium]|nr:hypothetical protein [Phycisphaerae bacterium]